MTAIDHLQVQFMWYGGEELGLLGSTYYVKSLQDKNVSYSICLLSLCLVFSIRTPTICSIKQASLLDDIAMMLNFDMVGSPNYIRGVYDAESASPETYGMRVYEGSSSIEVRARLDRPETYRACVAQESALSCCAS
jgi:Zn-dependent M28 family amino/carboxypeptidase